MDPRRLESVREQEPLNFAPLQDPDGLQWLAGLETLIERMCRRWQLQLDPGPVRNGYRGVVVPVRRADQPLVLKVSWPADHTAEEAHALDAWQGRGAVLMVEAATEEGVLLLERLNSDRTLGSLPLWDAATHAGRLVSRLSVPTGQPFPSLRELAAALPTGFAQRQEQLAGPIPDGLLSLASDLAEQLAPLVGDKLIHADLHYDNVLAGTREPWIAIDPRPMLGDPEFSLPELMWVRVDELGDAADIRRLLSVLTSAAELDSEKAREWVIVRAVDYWLWGLQHGLTVDPQRCARIVEALA